MKNTLFAFTLCALIYTLVWVAVNAPAKQSDNVEIANDVLQDTCETNTIIINKL